MSSNEWYINFDFTIDKQGWTPLPNGGGIQGDEYAVHDLGIGWRNAGAGSSACEAILIRTPPFSQSTYVYEVIIHVTQSIPTGGGPLWRKCTTSSWTRVGYTGNVLQAFIKQNNINCLHIGVDNRHSTSGQNCYNGHITRIEMYGTGVNPFTYYSYDRVAAANLAIGRSVGNFNSFPYGAGDQRDCANTASGDAPCTVGGPFTYSPDQFLTHVQGFTGSATFISEMLHLGGKLPMIYADSGDPCNLSESSAITGWRVCCDTVGTPPRSLATFSWKAHNGISNFFSDISDADFVGDGVGFATLQDYMRFGLSAGGETGGGTWRPGQQTAGQQFLYALFATGGELAAIDTGDYIYLDQLGNGLHGFLIVGWGPALNCPEAINATAGADFSVSRQHNGQEIPYVADFCYSYLPPSKNLTGWLQDPRPRPFYASAAEIDINAQLSAAQVGFDLADYQSRLRGGFAPFTLPDDTRPRWQFFQMPDRLVFDFSRIYFPPCG
jgi:hypothetical protein